MHFYTLTIMEETESEYKSELKVWENDSGNIWLQVGYDDNEPYSTQGIPLTPTDARALINELSRILRGIEGDEQRILGELIKSGQEKGEIATAGNPEKFNSARREELKTASRIEDIGLTHKQSSAFQQIADIPEETPNQGKQLPISKVNWGEK
jgi:hypothetical protein